MTYNECLEVSNLAGLMLCAVREYVAGGVEPARAVDWGNTNSYAGFPVRQRQLLMRIAELRAEVTNKCVASREREALDLLSAQNKAELEAVSASLGLLAMR